MPRKRNLPSSEQLKEELKRVKHRARYKKALRGTIWTLVVVAAASIILSTFLFTVLKTQGTSMEPVLSENQLVIAVKTHRFKTGEIVAFYYNNKILIKRVIGSAGDWVNIDETGDVYVNDALLDEPYAVDKTLGDGDITFPYQVPENRWFVLGDHRATSADSRSSIIGNVSDEQIIGKVVLRIWPLSEISSVK